MYTALSIIDLLLSVLLWIIIIRAVLSWLVAFNVVNTNNDFVSQVLSALSQITEPLYRPIRRIMPDFVALDFTPMVVMLIILIARRIIAANMMGALIAA